MTEPMRYISTRGDAPPLNFPQVLLAGLASDGGLYLPDRLPQLPHGLAGKPYEHVAAAVMSGFVGDSRPPRR